MSPLIAVLCLWATWFGSWMIARSWAKPTLAAPSPWSQLNYSLIIYVGVALLVVQDPHRNVPRLWSLPPILSWSMVASALAGFGLCWWARVQLGRTWSWGITRKEDHRVIDTGPYSIVRHPIYTGVLIAAVATAMLEAKVLSFIGLALLVAGLWIKARFEEDFLRAELGEGPYGDYARHTGMLFPSLSVRRMKRRPAR